jgi:hypothetical protein
MVVVFLIIFVARAPTTNDQSSINPRLTHIPLLPIYPINLAPNNHSSSSLFTQSTVMVAGLGIEESPTANKSNFTSKVSTPNLEQIRSRMAGCFDSFPHQFYFDWEAKRNTYSAIAAGFLVH